MASPIYSFATVEQFAKIHKDGTEAEFFQDARLIDQINGERASFNAWILTKVRQTTKRSEYVMLVQQGRNGEAKIPSKGAQAKVRVIFADGTFSRYWDVTRIENPLPSMGISTALPVARTAAFHVTVPTADYHEVLKPLFDYSGSSSKTAISPSPSGDRPSSPKVDQGCSSGSSPADSALGSSPKGSELSDREPPPVAIGSNISSLLTPSNVLSVNFHIFASESTKDSELGALTILHGPHQNASERQIKAFRYFVTLKNPEFYVSIYSAFPHMRDAFRRPGWLQTPLGKRFSMLNPQQRQAYLQGFANLPCGIAILPGGPGAGKTHFNLFTIAMAQSEPRKRVGKSHNEFAKVLFIVDMNSPVDDVANRMVRLYADLGMKKTIIRMKGWGGEVRRSNKVNRAEDAATGEMPEVDFSDQFLETVKLMTSGQTSAASCKAPSLDEAAWELYERHKTTKYEALTKYMEEDLFSQDESLVIPLRFRNLVYQLYQDTLAEADFVATTPVAASKHFRGMFRPDLVFFDESPHARELCNLVAIANFNPLAWIFCGDHRQTVPYVGSAGSGSKNPFAKQMQVSMMERAARAGVIRHELLMNHRAYGGLHQLASDLWYDGKMVAATNNAVSRPLIHVRNYIRNINGGKNCIVPRLIVHLRGSLGEKLEGTSSWNPSHMDWVMARIKELLTDPHFRKADMMEPATILIISPYKKAFDEYKKQLKQLPRWAQKRVEARTVDVSQGHEADFVFLDLSKERSTDFLDDPNRLCVALTRARLGEIIMMDPLMPRCDHFVNASRHLRRMYEACQSSSKASPNGCDQKVVNGHVAWADMEKSEPSDWAPALSEGSPTLVRDDLHEIDWSAVPASTRKKVAAKDLDRRRVVEYKRPASSGLKYNRNACLEFMGWEDFKDKTSSVEKGETNQEASVKDEKLELSVPEKIVEEPVSEKKEVTESLVQETKLEDPFVVEKTLDPIVSEQKQESLVEGEKQKSFVEEEKKEILVEEAEHKSFVEEEKQEVVEEKPPLSIKNDKHESCQKEEMVEKVVRMTEELSVGDSECKKSIVDVKKVVAEKPLVEDHNLEEHIMEEEYLVEEEYFMDEKVEEVSCAGISALNLLGTLIAPL
ncbi:P-loop containing nucleoside triphosphate hydrolase protein [Triangularia verruculosa]|uniref:P-loop containing nucleoside triphosphate hydrolase protein n=1 Tax=Triangularia verruculosa TaxID=2587418 RepID=A0AAN7AZ59_9PEZI|nr:P-loop containing nucleoside triphosphate hydrolase protein [Triangularia verruculosa]